MKAEGHSASVGKPSAADKLVRQAKRLQRINASLDNIEKKADKRQGYEKKKAELEAERDYLRSELSAAKEAIASAE